ncbi:MAG: helix-turn-helix domain-containing protein [Ferruginibacter sp.]
MSNIILTTHSELETLIQNSIRKVLNEGKEEPPEVSKEIFTIDEAGKFLNLAKQTLYGFTSKNLIPFIKRGKKLYFRKADLNKWLMDGKQLTKEEIEAAGFESLKNKKGGSK